MKKIEIFTFLLVGAFFCTTATIMAFEVRTVPHSVATQEQKWDIAEKPYQEIVEPTPQPGLLAAKEVAQKLKRRYQKAKLHVGDFGSKLVELDQLDKDGYPTKSIIEYIIQKKWARLGPIKVRDITEDEGGTFSGKLFVVQKATPPMRNVFFVKVSTSSTDREAKNLQRIQESPVGRLGQLAVHGVRYKNIERLPVITNVEMLVKYRDQYGVTRSIEFLHAAHGDSAFYLFKTIDEELLAETGYYIGNAIGGFHRAFLQTGGMFNPREWRTMNHNDLHQKNVFYDRKTKRVYLIDNEGIEEQPFEQDIIYFIFNYLFGWKQITLSFPQFKGVLIAFGNFLRGYVHAYPQNLQEQVARYLDYVIDEKITYLQSFVVQAEQQKKRVTGITLMKELGQWMFPFIDTRSLYTGENQQKISSRLKLLHNVCNEALMKSFKQEHTAN